FAPAATLASVIANEFAEATSDLYVSALIELGLVLLGLGIVLNVVARLLGAGGARQRVGGGREKAGATLRENNNTRRKFKSDFMMTITVAATVITLIPLFLVLGYLIFKGATSLNWAFFTHMPAPVGEKGGGMANAIIGTFEVVGIACLIGVPIGVGAGL